MLVASLVSRGQVFVQRHQPGYKCADRKPSHAARGEGQHHTAQGSQAILFVISAAPVRAPVPDFARVGMFCADTPVWRFLSALGAVEDPEAARAASQGIFVMEVFPAIALASFEESFFGRLAGPRYNPDRRKTFQVDHWRRVAPAAASQAETLGCADLALWFLQAAEIVPPAKADQDRLDAALYVLIALRWRRSPREDSLLLGDLKTGYMVLPASAAVRSRLAEAASRYGVPVDGPQESRIAGLY